MELQRDQQDRKLRFLPRRKDSATDDGKSQRQKYESEITGIRSRFGGLDNMRQQLGLSRRQICQILLVDPSAWTRWTAENDSAPAHVYKTLALIMEQNLRDPQVLASMKVNTMASVISKAQGQIHEVESSVHDLRTELRAEMHAQFENLKKSLNETSELSFGWKLLLILNIVLVLYALFR